MGPFHTSLIRPPYGGEISFSSIPYSPPSSFSPPGGGGFFTHLSNQATHRAHMSIWVS